MQPLPLPGHTNPRSHPNAHDSGEQPDGSPAAVGLGQQHNEDKVEHLAPVASVLERREEGNKRKDGLQGQPGNGSRGNGVAPNPSVGGEGKRRVADVVSQEGLHGLGKGAKRGGRVLIALLPKGGPVLGFLVDDSLVGEGGIKNGQGRIVEKRLGQAVRRLIFGVPEGIPGAGSNGGRGPPSQPSNPPVGQTVGGGFLRILGSGANGNFPHGSARGEVGSLEFSGFGTSHVGEGARGEMLPGG